jgi:hypothetical protein
MRKITRKWGSGTVTVPTFFPTYGYIIEKALLKILGEKS